MDKYEALRQYFGYPSFREGQEPIIDAILGGKDAFAILPTGGGKSICYQIPALLLPGITLVVSPLISLMKDQVMSLREAGIPAAFVNSTLTSAQMSKVFRNIETGSYKIVYIAPERLETGGFLELASRLKISQLAVDEAHCISEWGQDFRPSYLKIPAFVDALPCRPTVAAFTATATERVREDIVRLLGLRSPVSVLTGFDRPNLNFEVLQPANKMTALKKLIAERKGKSGIVYCATRNKVEQVCDALRESGIAATRYHAGLSEEERRVNQEDFVYDRSPVMVATNAFGMGIDKSNVGFVIHFNMPLSMEAYYQEAGRAGRDGSPADCILLWSGGDLHTALMLIENGNENTELTEKEKETLLRQNKKRLDQMVGYCKTTACLRAYILSYFGEAHPDSCGKCGNCRASFREEDMTVPAQKLLSCVRRAYDHLGYPVGKLLITQILAGADTERIESLSLDTISTYGLLREMGQTKIRELADLLEERGYLVTDPVHGGVSLTPAAKDILFGGVRLTAAIKETPKPEPKPKAKPKKKGKRGTASTRQSDGDLFEQLRTLRFLLAEQEKVPAYVIFSNATLQDMAEKMPTDTEELMTVSGVGRVKATKYGDAFISVIRNYLSDE